MAYDQNVISAFERAIRARRASPKVRKALYESGIVESGLRNLNYGDRDSLGALQERASIYGRGHASDPYRSALRFIDQAMPLRHQYGSAGSLAQAVQRSAFPGRYDQAGSQAAALMGGRVPHSAGGGTASFGGTPAPPAAGNLNSRQQLALNLVGLGNLTGGYGGGDLTDILIGMAGHTGQSGKVAFNPPQGPQPTQADIHGIVSRANQINSEHLPYKWGGGHGSAPAGPGVPVDCSGAVSRLLGVSPRVSGGFTKYGNPGPGKAVTIYANGHHVLMEINGHFWGTSGTNPNGGAGWIPRSAISKAYLKGFVARHPKDM